MPRPDAPQPATAATAPATEGGPLLRDQRRALHAYRCVDEVAEEPQAKRQDYQIVVNDLGATIRRSGLCAALAALERQKDGRGGALLAHIARADLPGLQGVTQHNLSARVRQLDVDSYMLVTREVLQVAAWLKRAAQATFGGESDA